MIGSIDSVYCVLISLGIWLEIYFMECNYSNDSPYLFALSPNCRFPQGAQSGKYVLRRIMSDAIFKSLGLIARDAVGNDGRGLGTHSFRKYGATHATKCGISRDNRDYRGRWKRDRRVSCVYDDVELPWVDCEVAAALCVGGPCKYEIQDSFVNNNFILNYTVPNMKRHVPESVCLVLGTALLYFCFTANGKK